MPQYRLVTVPTFRNHGATLGAIDQSATGFEIKRLYWVILTETDVWRGAHAHRTLQQLLLVPYGEVIVNISDASGAKAIVSLSDQTDALLLQPGWWRDYYASRVPALLLVAASETFDEGDYIRDWNEYVEWSRDTS